MSHPANFSAWRGDSRANAVAMAAGARRDALELLIGRFIGDFGVGVWVAGSGDLRKELLQQNARRSGGTHLTKCVQSVTG